MRERISRPNSSFPNGCFQDGPSSRSGNRWSAGSYGTSQGAKTPVTVNRVTIKRPTAANLFFSRNSVISNAWVNGRIQNIRDQIDQNVRHSNGQNASLHERIIPRIDRLNCQPAETGPRENRLRNESSGKQGAGIQSQQCNQWKQSVSQGVTEDNCRFRQSLRSRRADIVLPDFFQQRTSYHSR